VKDGVVKPLVVVTDSTIVCGKDLLWKIELYITSVNAVWRRNGLLRGPTKSESVQWQSCYSCCHSGESGRDRQVDAPSTVSRRADKTSDQRVAVKSSKEEFILPW